MKEWTRMKRTEFTVGWPMQGVACFRSQDSELVLSDVYWRWIFEALSRIGQNEQQLPFVDAVEKGFGDASNLVETIAVTPKFLELLGQVEASRAPPFDLVVAAEGCTVPTAQEVLDEFRRLVGEALLSAKMEMEIE